MDVREQIAALREQLRYHNEKYYNDDAPEISDYEYDMMQRSCVRSRTSTLSWRMRIPRRSGSAARRADASPR